MQKIFRELGLDEKETRVYRAILKLGQAHVLDIARKSGIPRATVYGILEKLITEDLISFVVQGKRKYYLAEDPFRIRRKIQLRQRKIDILIPKLQRIYKKSTHKPVIRVYEGAKGINKMLADILATVPDKGSYDVILNSKDEFAILGQDYYRHVERRIKRRISIRIISERSEFTKDWDKTAQKYLRQIKFVPRGQHFSVSYHLYGYKVSMFSLQGPVVGVIIENREIAEMEKIQFEYMWRGLK